MIQTITLEVMSPTQWELYRELRLAALLDAPDAFGSTFALEVVRPKELWQTRLAAAAESGSDLPLLARVDSMPAGLCWANRDAQNASVVNLFQMWVVPNLRRLGVGQSLLDRSISWARSLGASELCLGVTLGDSPAYSMYQRSGFVPQGEPRPLREGTSVQAQNMSLRFDAMFTNTVVSLLGFAGCGKRTVAHALGAVIEAKVVDNHSINNLILSLIPYNGVSRVPDKAWKEIGKVREAVLKTVVTLSPPMSNFIFTLEAVQGNASQRASFEAIQRAAARRRALFVAVRLTCDEGELVRRVQSPERVGLLKCIDPIAAARKARWSQVLDTGDPGELTLDVTGLRPDESAAAIVAHIRHVRNHDYSGAR
jgi:GNAT superfamily N-acetyltransferase